MENTTIVAIAITDNSSIKTIFVIDENKRLFKTKLLGRANVAPVLILAPREHPSWGTIIEEKRSRLKKESVYE